MWRPAGMSSDDDFSDGDLDDCYFSSAPPPQKESRSKSFSELLPPDINRDLKNKNEEAYKIALFHTATESCDLHTMHILIKEGVNVNESKPNELTPLLESCLRGNFEIVEFLLINGADPNLHKELFTPLMACCMSRYIPEENRLNCIRHLIAYGADVNAADKYKLTALMYAAMNNLNEIVDELLLIEDIDINKQDKDGWTALFHAVIANNKYIVEKLINAGISTEIMNIQNEYTAYQLAEIKNYKDLAKLIKKECDVSENEMEESYIYKDPLEAFLEELPSEDGKGGFSSEVRNIFSGLGLEAMYDRLNINISLPDFLVIKDLSTLGINLKPIRHKILIKGIHRYHLCPWMDSSLYYINNDFELSLDDCINIISNVAKHLCILYSTLHYIKIRIPDTTSNDVLTNKELLQVLVCNSAEIQNIRRLLNAILRLSEKVKVVGEYEADFVDKKIRAESKIKCKYLWFLAGSLTLATTIIYYKFY